MDDILFSKSFEFYLYQFDTYHYRNNSMGCPIHYVGHMLRGHVHFEVVGGESLDCREGDYFYIPKGLKYRSHWYGEPEILFESFGFAYLPDTRRFALQILSDQNGLYEAFRKADILRTDCQNIGLFYEALGQALGFMRCTYESGHHAVLQRAISCMKEHKAFTVKEIAREVHISESGLYAIFQKIKGMTPTQMKWQLQIEDANALLLTTDLSVEEIAERCGFSSAAYFRKILKRVANTTPRELRKRAGM